MEPMFTAILCSIISLCLLNTSNAVCGLRGMKKDQDALILDIAMCFCLIVSSFIWLIRLWM